MRYSRRTSFPVTSREPLLDSAAFRLVGVDRGDDLGAHDAAVLVEEAVELTGDGPGEGGEPALGDQQCRQVQPLRAQRGEYPRQDFAFLFDRQLRTLHQLGEAFLRGGFGKRFQIAHPRVHCVALAGDLERRLGVTSRRCSR